MSGKSASGDLIEIAEARRLLDAEVEKVVSLSFLILIALFLFKLI